MDPSSEVVGQLIKSPFRRTYKAVKGDNFTDSKPSIVKSGSFNYDINAKSINKEEKHLNIITTASKTYANNKENFNCKDQQNLVKNLPEQRGLFKRLFGGLVKASVSLLPHIGLGTKEYQSNFNNVNSNTSNADSASINECEYFTCEFAKMNKCSLKKVINIPTLSIDSKVVAKLAHELSPELLRLHRINPVADIDKNIKNKLLLLNPAKYSQDKLDTLPYTAQQQFTKHNLDLKDVLFYKLELDYECLSLKEVIDILIVNAQLNLSDNDRFKDTTDMEVIWQSIFNYTIVNDILIVQIHPKLNSLKKLIAEILFDKVNCVRSVIELKSVYPLNVQCLFGDKSLNTTIKLQNLSIELNLGQDFFHLDQGLIVKQLLEKIDSDDILYDCCCGNGILSLLSLNHGCEVITGSQSCSSIERLRTNVLSNNLCDKKLTTRVSRSAQDFILKSVRSDLLHRWSSLRWTDSRIHIVVWESAPAFSNIVLLRGLMSEAGCETLPNLVYPNLHYISQRKSFKNFYSSNNQDENNDPSNSLNQLLECDIETELQSPKKENQIPKSCYRINTIVLSPDILFKKSRKRKFSDSQQENRSDSKRKCL